MIPSSLIVLLRVSSLTVSGAGVHDGIDGAMVELVHIERVTKIILILGTVIIIFIISIHGWV